MRRFTPPPVYWDLAFRAWNAVVFYYRYEDSDDLRQETILIDKLHSRLWDKHGKRFADKVQAYCSEQLHLARLCGQMPSE